MLCELLCIECVKDEGEETKLVKHNGYIISNLQHFNSIFPLIHFNHGF